MIFHASLSEWETQNSQRKHLKKVNHKKESCSLASIFRVYNCIKSPQWPYLFQLSSWPLLPLVRGRPQRNSEELAGGTGNPPIHFPMLLLKALMIREVYGNLMGMVPPLGGPWNLPAICILLAAQKNNFLLAYLSLLFNEVTLLRANLSWRALDSRLFDGFTHQLARLSYQLCHTPPICVYTGIERKRERDGVV